MKRLPTAEPAVKGAPVKNYITPDGWQRLREEHRFLLMRERPAVTQVVAWAASNGDRSENADYQYGKRRLRQIDGRIRFLRKRIDAAHVVDPESRRRGSFLERRCATSTAPAPNSRSASSALTKSTSIAAISAGCRRWRVR